MPGVVWQYIVAGGVFLLMCAALVIMFQRGQSLELERDAAVNRANQYKTALEAYQFQFQAQIKTLNAEKRAEIERQNHLIKIMRQIGEIHENPDVPAASSSIINSMYGTPAAPAADTAH